MTSPRHPVGALALVALATVLVRPTFAETTQCTAITGLPWMISSPGTYCLTADLTTSATSGPAILIQVSSVTIDLNGHKLASTGGSASTTIGIHGQDRRYVVIKNGTIRGFHKAVNLTGNGFANIIEDITAERSWYLGLYVDGKGKRHPAKSRREHRWDDGLRRSLS
jgi:hypothetical protein